MERLKNIPNRTNTAKLGYKVTNKGGGKVYIVKRVYLDPVKDEWFISTNCGSTLKEKNVNVVGKVKQNDYEVI